MTRPPRFAAEKVVTLSTLLDRLREEKIRGKTVVFTNGCYDLLHAGHLHLLESAAAMGDLLVVGLNSDESVSRAKGPSRPLVPFSDRAVLLAGLEVVDWVVGFDEDTPAALVDAVLPDVLVKGGDWTPERIVGRETVESRGGRVVSVPLAPGLSSTSLVERIRADAPGRRTVGEEP